MKSNTRTGSIWATWLLGSAVIAGVVTAVMVYRHVQQRQSEPEYLADRAYRQGLRQVQTVESRIPRWLAERS